MNSQQLFRKKILAEVEYFYFETKKTDGRLPPHDYMAKSYKKYNNDMLITVLLCLRRYRKKYLTKYLIRHIISLSGICLISPCEMYVYSPYTTCPPIDVNDDDDDIKNKLKYGHKILWMNIFYRDLDWVSKRNEIVAMLEFEDTNMMDDPYKCRYVTRRPTPRVFYISESRDHKMLIRLGIRTIDRLTRSKTPKNY